jgi:hypothetical protein
LNEGVREGLSQEDNCEAGSGPHRVLLSLRAVVHSLTREILAEQIMRLLLEK